MAYFNENLKKYDQAVKCLKKVSPYHISEAEFRTGNCCYSLKQYDLDKIIFIVFEANSAKNFLHRAQEGMLY